MNLNIVGDFNVLEVEKSREDGVVKNNKVWFMYDKETRCFRETVKEPVTITGKDGNVINVQFAK